MLLICFFFWQDYYCLFFFIPYKIVQSFILFILSQISTNVEFSTIIIFKKMETFFTFGFPNLSIEPNKPNYHGTM